MKKYLIVVVVFMLTILCFATACSKNKEIPIDGEYSIVAPDGATALALSSIISNPEICEGVTMVPQVVASELIVQRAVQSDFAIVPSNVAAKLYNQNQKYKVISVVTNGNLFLLSTIENNSFEISNMVGKIVYSIGQGAIPSAILISIIKQSGYDIIESDEPVDGKVAIKYCADGSQVIQQLALNKNKGKEVYAMLAEPAVTNAINNEKGYMVADIQELWKNLTGSSVYGFAQAVLICKSELVEKDALIKAIVSNLKENENWIIENSQKSRDLISSIYEVTSLPKTLVPMIVTKCNVKTYETSNNANAIYLKTTLDKVYSVNANMIGGEVPALDSGFYA